MKRLLSVLLVLVMVLSMTACGSLGKRPTVRDVLDNFQAADVNTLEFEASIQASGQTIALKFEGGYDENENAYISILAKLTMNAYSMDDYYELTNMYIVGDDTMYIDVEQVMDFLVNLDSQFEMWTTTFELPAEYIVCTEEEFLVMCSELTGTEIAGIQFEQSEDLATKAELEVMDLTEEFIEEFAKVASGVATEVQKDRFMVNINNDNLGKVLGCLADMDMASYGSRFADLFVESGVWDDEQEAKFRKSLGDINNAFVAAASQYDDVKDRMGYVNIVFEMGVQGKNPYMSGLVESDDFNVSTSYKGTPDKIQNFSLPANTMTADEFVQMFYDYGLM